MADTEFLRILREHQAKYPLMQMQDYAKLAFQNEFGPEHNILNPFRFLSLLREEWGAVPRDGSPRIPEQIGNHLYRFYLTGEYDPIEAAPLLTELSCRTAREHRGAMADFLNKLVQLEHIPDPDHWLQSYRARGCPPVHHSEPFRRAYQPHYRLLLAPYAQYFPVLLRISSLVHRAKPVVIAIDGRCGSGKTNLTELIASIFPCNVFHMDDFYLPFHKRNDNWRDIPGGNMDFTRLLTEILSPAAPGQVVNYQPYDCHNGTFLPTAALFPQTLNIVEGSYSHTPTLTEQYDLKIFLTCSRERQADRLREREGSHYNAFVNTWIPLEEQHFQIHSIEQSADIIVDTTDFF